MKAFDDTLNALRHVGQVLLSESYTAPWAIHIPNADKLGQLLALDRRARAVPFHFVRRGSFHLRVSDRDAILINEGETAILFGGKDHLMYERSTLNAAEFSDIIKDHQRSANQEAGSGTELICGVFVMTQANGNPMFEALPNLLVADLSGKSGGRTLCALGNILASEIETPRMGSSYMIGRLLQMLCAEAIRAHLENGQDHGPNWFNGLRDRKIGGALNLIHTDPAAAVTVPDLARHAGMSGSRFAARFREKLGVSPIRYLASWRMALAAQHLAEGEKTVSQVAEMVGYESLPAFNRAFRRAHGCPPGAWRTLQADKLGQGCAF